MPDPASEPAADQDNFPRRGIAVRPVAIPDDVDDPRVLKQSGRITLPVNVRWSGRPTMYDLTDPQDLKFVYEQVLREGTEEDVRSIIEVDKLIELWDDLSLPDFVRRPWADWVLRHRGVKLAC